MDIFILLFGKIVNKNLAFLKKMIYNDYPAKAQSHGKEEVQIGG